MTTLPVLDRLQPQPRMFLEERDSSLCQQGKNIAESLHTQLENPQRYHLRYPCRVSHHLPVHTSAAHPSWEEGDRTLQQRATKVTAMPDARHTNLTLRTSTKPDSSAPSENCFKHGGRNNDPSAGIKFACVSQLTIEHQSAVHFLCASQLEQLCRTRSASENLHKIPFACRHQLSPARHRGFPATSC